MRIFIDAKTTQNKYQGHGVGVYTEGMLTWLPRVSSGLTVETKDWRGCDIYLQPSFYDGFPLGFRGLRVVMVHDLTLLKFRYFSARGSLVNFLRGLEYRWKIRCVSRADVVITNSENTRQDVIELLKVPSHKVKAIYLGLKDVGEVGAGRDVGQPQDRYLLYVGGVEFNKNIVRLVKAFAQVKGSPHSGLERLKLVLVGGGFRQRERPETAKVFEQIHRLGLDADVICPGYVPDRDLRIWYHSSLAFVYPSFYEGFGFPVLEAMACGTPVVTSNVSSLPEVGGDAVVYFDPYQVDDMAEKILSVIRDERARQQLIARGYKRARLYSWEKTARQTYQVFCSFLGA